MGHQNRCLNIWGEAMENYRYIKVKIGRDLVLCSGCTHAKPFGIRQRPYWFCEVYSRHLGMGRPTRCTECVMNEIQDGSRRQHAIMAQ